MDIYRAEFGKRLKEARLRAGLKQHHLAEAAHVEQSAVSNWETGKDFPEDDRLPDICRILNVDPEYFVLRESAPHIDPLPGWANSIRNGLSPIERGMVDIRSKMESLPEKIAMVISESMAPLSVDEKELIYLFSILTSDRQVSFLNDLRLSVRDQSKNRGIGQRKS